MLGGEIERLREWEECLKSSCEKSNIANVDSAGSRRDVNVDVLKSSHSSNHMKL